jgi:small-conductance mechanosensitive channel
MSPGTKSINARNRAVLTTYFVLLAGLGVVYYLLRIDMFHFAHTVLIRRIVAVMIYIILLLAISRLLEVLLLSHIDDIGTRYNLRRLLRLMTMLILTLIAVEALVANWTTAVVSLGLITLILGFALQTPITSFIGWIYIIVRIPYRIGDRIRLGDSAGDVIDIGYLDTTLWEYGGTLVGHDDPSGRIIKFPNSNVLSSAIYNYSWSMFPFVWNQVALHVGYQSDLKFVAETMMDAAREELGGAAERVAQLREPLSDTHINPADIREEPTISFRASENSWIEASVRYLVLPRDASDVSTRLLERIVTAFNAASDRVQVPQGDGR